MVEAAPRLAGDDVGVIRGALAAGVVINRGAAHFRATHGQVADLVFVDQQRLFLRHRQGVEARGLGEGGVDQRLIHAVVADEIEADILAGPAEFLGQAAAGAGLACEVGA